MKTRFAPSPTGLIHLGNLRTAFFNFLAAHSAQGVFLLRIEDTDPERSREEFVEALLQDLRWLGLQWDEGPEVRNDEVVNDNEPAHSSYFQSQRNEVYDEYFERLIQHDKAYPCFCTPEELSLSRKLQRSAGKAPRYAGTCARLSREEAEQKKQQGLDWTLRFRVPQSGQVAFTDVVRGQQQFECNDIGDFIIRRSNGTPAFFFSNAIDDSLMKVTLVLRGEDHLTNTPRQKLILQALDMTVPEYGHISLIVGSDGKPLAKRTGSMSVRELREKGYLPAGVLNYLARLGHHYEDEHFMSLDELSAQFKYDKLGKAPAKFEGSQLLYWQKHAVAQLDHDQLWQWISEHEQDGLNVASVLPENKREEFLKTIHGNLVFPQDGLAWAANLFSESGSFDAEAAHEIKTKGQEFFQLALECLSNSHESFKSFSQELGKRTDSKGKQLFMPLRAAITGEVYTADWNSDWKQGPQMGDVWTLLGEQRIRRRLQLATEI